MSHLRTSLPLPPSTSSPAGPDEWARIARDPSDPRELRARDDFWTSRIRAGDDAAFVALFHRYFPPLRDYAFGYLRDRDEAEEVVGQLFHWLWGRRREWGVRANLTRYLYVAVRNRCYKILRDEGNRARIRRRWMSHGVPPGMGHPSPEADQRIEGEQLEAMILRTIETLPPRAREAFRLCRAHRLRQEDAAAIMGISLSTLEKHLARSGRVLRDAVHRWFRD